MRFDIVFDLLKQYMIIAAVLTIIFLFLFLFMYFIFYKKIMHGTKQLNKNKTLLAIISFIYAFIVFGAVFLNRHIEIDSGIQQLFSSYKSAWYSCSLQGWRNIVLNILLFVPLGILVPMWNKKWNKLYIILPIGLVTTLLIEFIQYAFKIGVFESDDILNNVIGVILGYSIFQLVLILRKKINSPKKIVLNIIPLLFLICTFLGVFIAYQIQPYGNLMVSYYERQDMSNVEVISSIELSEKRNNVYVYSTKKYTVDDANELANFYFQKVNAIVDYKKYSLENGLYSLNSVDEKYCFSMNLNDGSYNFHNKELFQIDSESPDTSYTENQVREVLEKYSVVPPQNSDFIVNENSGFEFDSNMELVDGSIFNGEIYCSMFSDLVLGEIDNHMIELETYQKENIISETDVFSLIKEGKFNTNGVHFENCTLRIISIDLIYLCDSKNYYQPVYKVNADIITESSKETTIIIPAIMKNSTERISDNTVSDETKKVNVESKQHFNLEIAIDDKIYSLYCNESDDILRDYDDYLNIETSDIGAEIIILDQINMGEIDIYTGGFNNMNETEAKAHPLYHAKIYRYNNCKNDTLVLAESKGNYYMFKLLSFITDCPESSIFATDIFDIYSSFGKNPVMSVEINKSEWKKENDRNFQTITPIKTISNRIDIDSIINVLNSSIINNSEKEIFNNLNKLSKDKYYITFIFEDNTRLQLSVTENYYYFSIIFKNRYGYYLLDQSQFELLKDKFEL